MKANNQEVSADTKMRETNVTTENQVLDSR